MLKKWIAGLLSACIVAGNVAAGASSLATVNYFAASAKGNEAIGASKSNTPESVYTNEKENVGGQKIVPSSDTGLNPPEFSNTPLTNVVYLDDIPKYTKIVTQNYYSEDLQTENFFYKCSSRYGYDDIVKRSSPEGRKKLYDDLMTSAMSFWNNNNNVAVDESNGLYIINDYNYQNYGLTEDEAIEVYYTFKNDNPLFYFASNTVALSGNSIFLLTDSDYSQGKDRENIQDKIKSYINDYNDEIIENNIYGSLLNIHDNLNYDISYVDNYETADTHNIVGAIVDGEGVCEAYARTYQLLLNYYGYDNYVVTGIANGVSHIWNIAKNNDGNYYYIDCTFDDSKGTTEYFMFGSQKAETDRSINTSENTGGTFLCELPSVNNDDFTLPLEVEYTENGLVYSISYYSERATLTGYIDNPIDVIIPDTIDNIPVKEIAAHAFANCESLETVSIPASVIRISGDTPEDGYGSFEGCLNLEKVLFESNSKLRIIGYYTFGDCAKLSTISLPHSVKEIGEGSFLGCTSLMSLDLFEGIKFVGQCGINNTGISSLHIPSTLTEIGVGAFSYNFNLETITVSENNPKFKVSDNVLYQFDEWSVGTVDYLTGNISFKSLGSGWSIEVYPDKKNNETYDVLDETLVVDIKNKHLKKINIKNAYFIPMSCDVDISNSNPYYTAEDGVIYSKDKSELYFVPPSKKELSILNSAESIGSDVFRYSNVEEITIPDNIRVISSSAFYLSKIKTIVLPDSIENIGDNAFRDCLYLEKIKFPSSLKVLPIAVCQGCRRLRQVELPEKLEEIPFQAFCGTYSLAEITLPKSLKVIGDKAFYNSGFYEICLPKGVEKIEDEAFYQCNFLSLISISDTVKEIGSYAFSECNKLRYLRFEGDCPKLEENIFDNICDVNDENPIKLIVNYPIEFSEYSKIKDMNFGCKKEIEWRVYDCKNHHYTQEKIPATCTTGASYNYRCENCNDEFGVFYHEKITHVYFQPDDIDSFMCDITSLLENAGHKLTKIEEKDPTVEKDGNIEHWKCEKCGKLFSDENGIDEISKEEVKIPCLKLTTTSIVITTTTKPTTATTSTTTTKQTTATTSTTTTKTTTATTSITTTKTTTATTSATTTKSTTATTSSTTTKTTTATTSATTMKLTTVTTSATTTKSTTGTTSATTTKPTTATTSTTKPTIATTSSATTTQTTTTAATTSTTATPPITTSTSTSVTNIADDDLCSWAINDYQKKTGIIAAAAEITARSEDAYEITLTDENGGVLDVYTVDPKTGVGTDSSDTEVNLPQTGNNAMTNRLICIGAVLLIGFGLLAVKASGTSKRKKGETAED